MPQVGGGYASRRAFEELSENTPTVEELFASTFIPSITATFPAGVMVCPFPLRIVAASIMVYTGSQVASDTNYWTVQLRKHRAGASLGNMVEKTTRLTGGEAITQRLDWNFDGLPTWYDVDGFQTCAKGDGIDFAFVKTGTATNLSNVVCTIRYEPV